MRREVERLIAAADDAESFIEAPAWATGGLPGTVVRNELRDAPDPPAENGGSLFDAANEFVGRKIGVFELKRELGRGGMGTVYLAERADGEFRQEVAVKLINRGMGTDFIVKRFRHERQILAALEHSFIARLLTGGTRAEGLPYFVLEYVEGERLYPFCDRRRLGTGERLRLFLKICAAANMMRQILVDHARRHNAEKRGGEFEKMQLEESIVIASKENSVDLLALDAVLEELAEVDPQKAKLVELRHFGGLSVEETARVLDVSDITVKRHWRVAKAWLYDRLKAE